MNTCAVKNCTKPEYRVTVEEGSFGTVVVIPFCKKHWSDEEKYQEEPKAWESSFDEPIKISSHPAPNTKPITKEREL